MHLLIISLLTPSHACEPESPWVAVWVWPTQDEVVPVDAAPLASVFTEYTVEVALERTAPDFAVVAGQVVRVPQGGGEVVRFVPDEALSEGEYTLTVRTPDADFEEVSSFEVSGRLTSQPAQPVTNLEAEWTFTTVHGGDPCGPDTYWGLNLSLDSPAEGGIARSVHLADSPTGPIELEPVFTTAAFGLGYSVIPDSLTHEERACVAVASWGIKPEHDAMSTITCAAPVVEDGGLFGGRGCSASAAPVGPGLLLAGLAVLGLRRRRR